jgi:hypothetical protein
VSTVVVRTMQRQPLSEIDDPRAHLMKAVLNEARTVWRRRRAEPLPESLAGDLPVEVVETLDVVWRLPAQQRAVVYLFYWEGHPVLGDLVGVAYRRGRTTRRTAGPTSATRPTTGTGRERGNRKTGGLGLAGES